MGVSGRAISLPKRGHLAFRTDDIGARKRHTGRPGIPYPDLGTRAMGGWHQIFPHDRGGNIVEVDDVRE